MTVTIEKAGRRFYLVGNTYAIKDQLRDAGCKWDRDRKAWWTGKADVAEQFAGKEVKPAKENLADKNLHGKVSYAGATGAKAREYYVLASTPKNGGKLWLTVLDGSIDFWALESSCRWIKRYDPESYRPTTLASIRQFIADKKADEAVAKVNADKVKSIARGEHTVQIPNLTEDRIIAAFFGGRAVAYDYEVTQRDFDEYDNEGPGHYCGVTVPQSLAARWDAGVKACKAAGVETRSREGLLLRYRLMIEDEAAVLPISLVDLAAEREAREAAAQAVRDADAKKDAAEMAAVELLLEGLVKSSVGPTAPENVSVKIDGCECGHHMASHDPGDCTFGGDGMARLIHNNSTYTQGRTSDGQRVVREDIRSYDDSRVYYYAPASVAKAWALAAAKSQGITVEAAKEWLSKYAGCHGDDLYAAVAAE